MFLVVDFSDVFGITVQCVDGGYFVLRPGTEPIACRHSADVLRVVTEFLQLKVSWEWDQAPNVISHPCSACIMATVKTPDGTPGFALTWVMAQPPHHQFLRFSRVEVLRVIARWMGLVQRPNVSTAIDPPQQEPPAS